MDEKNTTFEFNNDEVEDPSNYLIETFHMKDINRKYFWGISSMII